MTPLPPGYIIMTAGEILAGCQACVAKHTADLAEWDADLPAKLAMWHSTLSNWRRICAGAPRDPAKLVAWYMAAYDNFNVPNDVGVRRRPIIPGHALDWISHTEDLDASTAVFIRVDQGAAITSWISEKS